MRAAWLSVAVAVAAVACSTAEASAPARGHPLASQLQITPAPRTTPLTAPSFVPGPNFTGGKVVAIDGTQLRLATFDDGGHALDVHLDMRSVRSVWRETEVRPSAIEIGDDLMVSGAQGPDAFQAWTVWANIGRADGIVRAIDGETIVLEALPPKSGTFTAVLSPYITRDGPWRLSDIRPGMTLGMVVYWRRGLDGPRRITRIWSG
jgi:hypothetical protein